MWFGLDVPWVSAKCISLQPEIMLAAFSTKPHGMGRCNQVGMVSGSHLSFLNASEFVCSNKYILMMKLIFEVHIDLI